MFFFFKTYSEEYPEEADVTVALNNVQNAPAIITALEIRNVPATAADVQMSARPDTNVLDIRNVNTVLEDENVDINRHSNENISSSYTIKYTTSVQHRF